MGHADSHTATKSNLTNRLQHEIETKIHNHKGLFQNKGNILTVLNNWIKSYNILFHSDIANIILNYTQLTNIDRILTVLECRQNVIQKHVQDSYNEVKKLYPPSIFNPQTLLNICNKCRLLLEQEPNVLQLTIKPTHKLFVIGVLKGQFRDLLHWLKLIDLHNNIRNCSILFLGNYVDHNRQSLETILYLFSLKLIYPNNIFILQGKHETSAINSIYGFRDEIKQKMYESNNVTNNSKQIYCEFNKTMQCLPYCALINESIFAVSGCIASAMICDDFIEIVNNMDSTSNFDMESIAMDMMFKEIEDRDNNNIHLCLIEEFCNYHNIHLFIRGKDFIQNGYCKFKYSEETNCDIIGLFSNANYEGSFENDAAIMEITCSKIGDCQYAFKVLKAEDVIEANHYL